MANELILFIIRIIFYDYIVHVTKQNLTSPYKYLYTLFLYCNFGYFLAFLKQKHDRVSQIALFFFRILKMRDFLFKTKFKKFEQFLALSGIFLLYYYVNITPPGLPFIKCQVLFVISFNKFKEKKIEKNIEMSCSCNLSEDDCDEVVDVLNVNSFLLISIKFRKKRR
jgi:hypothetical protein